MNRQTPPRLPACPPPADPGSAAVVAHASESSSGACTLPTLEHFQRWLETKAHAAFQKVSGSSRYDPTPEELGHALVVAECRAATKLLMQFKQESGA